MHYITLHYITLRYITLHYVTLRYITLHYIILHYIILHYITLHYITLHYIHIYIYIYGHMYHYANMFTQRSRSNQMVWWTSRAFNLFQLEGTSDDPAVLLYHEQDQLEHNFSSAGEICEIQCWRNRSGVFPKPFPNLMLCNPIDMSVDILYMHA